MSLEKNAPCSLRLDIHALLLKGKRGLTLPIRCCLPRAEGADHRQHQGQAGGSSLRCAFHFCTLSIALACRLLQFQDRYARMQGRNIDAAIRKQHPGTKLRR
jgi:hypothetical protein